MLRLLFCICIFSRTQPKLHYLQSHSRALFRIAEYYTLVETVQFIRECVNTSTPHLCGSCQCCLSLHCLFSVTVHCQLSRRRHRASARRLPDIGHFNLAAPNPYSRLRNPLVIALSFKYLVLHICTVFLVSLLRERMQLFLLEIYSTLVLLILARSL